MNRTTLVAAASVLALAAVAGAGYWLGQRHNGDSTDVAGTMTADAPRTDERKPLYWYDPMSPQHRFDKPGKSPFMDMQLVPKYADDDTGGGVQIDPVLAQNLGLRTAAVESAPLAPWIDAVASVSFNERDVAIVQARTHGFVERVYRLAPGDVVAAGNPIADILVPEWTAAQREFLALKPAADETLITATRERLKLLGMSDALIERVERTNEPHPVVTVMTPSSGVLQSLEIRTGMTVAPGMTLARVNGLKTVWMEAAVPEAQASVVALGAMVEARLPAMPGHIHKGKVSAVLPEANVQTRTLRVRAEFPNINGQLKPGLYAQMRIATGAIRETLVVPTEAVIRTGKRTLVIVASSDNRFEPVDIETGAEADGKTEILRGLSAGQKVVVSGQFLIDSEASLKGALGRMQNGGEPQKEPPQ